jgi:WD40 repeat protein
MKSPHFVAIYKIIFAWFAMLLLLEGCVQKTQPPLEPSTPSSLTIETSPSSPTFTAKTDTPTPPAPIPPTAEPLPSESPVIEYSLPPQFIARLNLGEVENFEVSDQYGLLAVASVTHICLFTTASYKLVWCTLTEPEIGMVIPENASSNNKSIKKMAFRQDGQQLAVALWNGYILILDIANGNLMMSIETGQANINYLAWLSDSTQIIIDSHQGGIMFWEARTGKLFKQLDIEPNAINRVTWSYDGKFFATTDSKSTSITIWDTDQIVPTATIDIQSIGFISSLAFSPDNKTLYAGIATPFPCEENCDYSDPEYKGWIAIYSLEHENLVHKTFVGDAISHLEISPDGNQIAAGGNIFGSFVVLDMQHRIMVKLSGTHADFGLGWLDDYHVLYLPNQNHIDAMSISQWDVKMAEHSEILLPGFETIESLAWLPDGKRLITNSAGGTLSLWNARNGQLLEKFQLAIEGEPIKRFEPGWISPVEDLLAVALHNSLAIVNLDTRQVVAWMDHTDLGERINVADLVWSRDGQRLMAGIVDLDHTGKVAIAIWELATGKRFFTIPSDYNVEIYRMAFSPDGDHIALSRTLREPEFKHQLVTIELSTGKEIQVLSLETTSFKIIWIAPDEIAFEYCGQTHKWNLVDGSDLTVAGATGYPAIRSDGSFAASPCFGVGISLWDYPTGREIGCLEIPVDSFGYKSLSFSPDGSILASLSRDGSVLLWDTSGFSSP